MCGQVLVWRRTGPFLLTNDGCRCCSFQCISSVYWAYFSDVVVLLGFRKLSWIKPTADQQTVTMAIFSVLVWFCEALRRFSFFMFPICFKCQMIIEWSTLSSLATFCVVVRGAALLIALSWSLSTSDGWPLSSSSSRLSISFAKLLDPELHCISVSSSWAKGVASCLYDPFWTGIKKSLKFTFGLASFL